MIRPDFLLVILVACSRVLAQAPDAAQIKHDNATIFATTQPHLSLVQHGPIAKQVEPILIQQARYLLATLRPWEKDKTALLLTAGNSAEADIRPNAHTAFGLAVLSRCVPLENSSLNPALCRDQSIALLRFLLPTHGAGGATTNNGKQWNSQWQSALWAFDAGKAAWLLWDDLDPRLKWLAARMIADEADRFIDRPTDHQVEKDTKAEENAWNSQIIALAFNMFPNHPHHERWGKSAIAWQISAFATAADTKRTDVIDGKPLDQWLHFPNIYDDYTLENHNRVHPDYMNTIRINAAQRLVYDWAKNPAPQAISFNVEKVYASLKKLAFPDGGYVYPNGQDWQLHRACDFFDAHAIMACVYNDPQAARLMRICLAAILRMQARDPAGAIYQRGEIIVQASHQVLFALHSDAYLFLRSYGEGPPPVSEEQLCQQLHGTHLFAFGKFAVLRTEHSVATFSWGREVMGTILPLRQDLLLTPNERSLVGIVNVKTAKGESRDTPLVKQFRLLQPVAPPIPNLNLPPDCLALAGVLSRGDGLLLQPFAFLALSDGRVIYLDSPRLTSAKAPPRCEFGTLGVLNDKNWIYHDGTRTLFFAGGERTFAAAEAATEGAAVLSSRWFNLDGLGIVVLRSSGQALYDPHPTKAPGRLEQLFHLNHPTTPTDLQPTAAIFYPTQDWDQTRAAAEKCALVQPDADHFVITLDDSKTLTIDLTALTIATAP